MGGQGGEFSPTLAVWLVSVSYRHLHLVVGILVGIFDTVPFGSVFTDLVGTLLHVSHRLRRYIGKTYVYLYLSLLPMWEFDYIMKISTGEATCKLIYTDRQTDGRTDRQTDGCC